MRSIRDEHNLELHLFTFTSGHYWIRSPDSSLYKRTIVLHLEYTCFESTILWGKCTSKRLYRLNSVYTGNNRPCMVEDCVKGRYDCNNHGIIHLPYLDALLETTPKRKTFNARPNEIPYHTGIF